MTFEIKADLDPRRMEIDDPGHIYRLRQLGGGFQELKFVKRSGGAIKYGEEWAGVQVQEVLRCLIDRTKYLDAIIPCEENAEALFHLRSALLAYEKRAYRRKKEHLNREAGQHSDEVTFPESAHRIEEWLIDTDGHISIDGAVLLYRLNYGWDYEND